MEPVLPSGPLKKGGGYVQISEGGVMKRFWSTKGDIRLSSILTLAVIAFAIYEGVQFVPVLFAQYEFKDAVVEEAKFSANKKADTVRDNLLGKASELPLPITQAS